MQFKLKNDKYRRARGGYSRFLHVYCSQCGKHLFLYQKDGPGPLKRAYLDRIIAPENLTNLELKDVSEITNLACLYCKNPLGTPYIYEKENRKAFLLNPKKFYKKIGKGIHPFEVDYKAS